MRMRGARRRVLVTLLGEPKAPPRLEPVHRERKGWILETGSRRSGARALAIFVIAPPSDRGDIRELRAYGVEGGIVEARLEAGEELGPPERDTPLPFSHIRLRALSSGSLDHARRYLRRPETRSTASPSDFGLLSDLKSRRRRRAALRFCPSSRPPPRAVRGSFGAKPHGRVGPTRPVGFGSLI